MSTDEFQGVTYLRADLPDGLLAYIDAYNQSLAASQTPVSDTNDYSFRMNQALQMFGDPVVVAAIQDAADSHGVDLR